MNETQITSLLLPEDEYPHEPDEAENYNESMYLNGFDAERRVGGWFRLGNRVNEGYAEMTVCLYLPGGRVGFMYGRPAISDNSEMRAGGLHIEVIKPFEHLRVTYEGNVVVLDEPEQMSNPRQAFSDNPHEPCSVELDMFGVSPMYGGRPVNADGSDIEQVAEKSFAKAHYEQHTRSQGTIRVGDEVLALDGLGLRDKSWGPRYWQAISWYRWLPMAFTEDFAMMLSIIGNRRGGMVLEGGSYHKIVDCSIESDFDERYHQTAMRCWALSETGTEYEVTGEVLSLIPLRNRRKSPDGTELFTRITEAMTEYKCVRNGEELTGIGMSEYLDQIIDGKPVGEDVPT
ncbi:MAG: hypothetical protein V3V01_05680 [Acidimicrobiales bacterium]